MGISMLDFLYEYFMNQLYVFVAVVFLIWCCILFLFDFQKAKVVLEQCPGNIPCAFPCGLLYPDLTCLAGAGITAQPSASSRAVLIYSNTGKPSETGT